VLKLSLYLPADRCGRRNIPAEGTIFTQWWRLKIEQSLVHLARIRQMSVSIWMSNCVEVFAFLECYIV